MRKKEAGEPQGKTSKVFYIAMGVAFLVANPPVLLPQVWSYLNAYTGEKLLVHSGYLFADHLYTNQVSSTPFGMPIYFYLLFMAIKIPLLVLGAFLVGLSFQSSAARTRGMRLPSSCSCCGCAVFADWSEMAALHAFADAVCLHAGGDWRD